jgi:hypothetical protein
LRGEVVACNLQLYGFRQLPTSIEIHHGHCFARALTLPKLPHTLGSNRFGRVTDAIALPHLRGHVDAPAAELACREVSKTVDGQPCGGSNASLYANKLR